MNNKRRSFIAKIAALGAVALTALGKPLRAWAAEWNKLAFDAKTLPEALQGAGLQNLAETSDIVIRAPDIAENSAVVPVEMHCKMPGVRTISLFADKNPQPLVAQFVLGEGVEAYISTRIKMGDTGNIRVVAQTDGKNYTATKEVKVTIGGCG